VTIVLNHWESVLGSIENDVFIPKPPGLEITKIWIDLPDWFPVIELDEFCIMPNHFHGIVVINPPEFNYAPVPVGAALVAARNTIEPHTNRAKINPANQVNLNPADRAGINPAPTRQPALGEIIGAFKSLSTNAYIQGVRNNGWQAFDKTMWQRNYYEHIIRDEDELTVFDNISSIIPFGGD
jgi:putative transposase